MIVAVTQRADNVETYLERRDSLDQRWAPIFEECGILPILIPNNSGILERILKTMPIEGVLLTGGGDLAAYGGTTPERDAVEELLLKHAVRLSLPVLGVCRGMQAIQNFFGVSLQRVQNHVGCRHIVRLQGKSPTVNSFHNWGAYSTVPELEVVGISDDQVIEAIQHSTLRIKGIMWHPERETSLSDIDREIFTSTFKG